MKVEGDSAGAGSGVVIGGWDSAGAAAEGGAEGGESEGSEGDEEGEFHG